MKQELKIAPLKVYFFFTAFNNSKQGFQRHRKVFLWGIYAAPTSGAVQTQAHLALCSLGAADKLLLTSPYFQTISEILCHSPSMPRNLNTSLEIPLVCKKLSSSDQEGPLYKQGLSTPSCSLLFLSVIRLSVTIEGWEGLETWGDGTRAPFTNPLATPLFAQQVQPMEISTFQHGHVVKTISS